MRPELTIAVPEENDQTLPRFVVLEHQMPADSQRGSHWDLMLEQGDCLLTWAMDTALEAGRSVRAEQLPPHRIDYLEYEGPVSRDRGTVRRCDRGTFEWIAQDADRLVVILSGSSVQMQVELTRQRESQFWLLSCRDRFTSR